MGQLSEAKVDLLEAARLQPSNKCGPPEIFSSQFCDPETCSSQFWFDRTASPSYCNVTANWLTV